MTEDEIIKNIKTRNFTVAIVGLGYVGLPLLWTFHEKGFPVLGLDIDQKKIDFLKEGKSYISHISNSVFESLALSKQSTFTSEFSQIKNSDAILICVPTPLNKYREPDMSFIISTLNSIIPYIRKNQLIVLESTTYPGTTDEIVKKIIYEKTGYESNKDIYIAYSPEREDPGNSNFNTSKIPKVIGADGETAINIANTLYSSIVVETISVSNTKTAEAVKLLENVFRSVNIALVNELKIVFHEMGIDIHEVINAAKTKPFGFMPFYPGPGLGGHCIPIDPFYLTWKAREFGVNTKFIELAGEINTAMPHYVVKRTIEALNSKGKSLKSSQILCIGLAYKPDIDDYRESPTFKIMDIFSSYGAIVEYYDPYIPKINDGQEHANWKGKSSIEWENEIIAKQDCVVIITNHKIINYNELMEWSDLIVDTRNSFPNLKDGETKIWSA
jgi:UDP-N-acetyl-D-glucosamine dehydrogenase